MFEVYIDAGSAVVRFTSEKAIPVLFALKHRLHSCCFASVIFRNPTTHFWITGM